MKYSSSKVAPSNFVEQLEEKAPIQKKLTNEENYFKSPIDNWMADYQQLIMLWVS